MHLVQYAEKMRRKKYTMQRGQVANRREDDTQRGQDAEKKRRRQDKMQRGQDAAMTSCREDKMQRGRDALGHQGVHLILHKRLIWLLYVLVKDSRKESG